MNNPGYFENKQVLVTGAGGYLAGRLIAALLPAGAKIRCLSRNKKSPLLPCGIEWIQGDMKEPGIWSRILPGTDLVFHLAAQTSARWADENPEQDYEINVRPMLYLLEAAENFPNLLIIFAATATQCGIPDQIPVSEKLTDRPVTAYDRHKLLAETALLDAVRRRRIRGASLRLCNLYGPGTVSGSKDRGILNQMTSRALQGHALTLVQNGESLIRDYLYIEDAVNAFLEAALSAEKISGAYYVIGSGQGHTLRQAFQKVAEYASRKLSREIPVTLIPGALSRIDRRNFVADSSLFKSKTGWSPRVSLDQGIELMIEELSCVS